MHASVFLEGQHQGNMSEFISHVSDDFNECQSLEFIFIHTHFIRVKYLSVVLCQVLHSAEMSMNCEPDK